MNNQTVVIIGAGVAGLSSAWWLSELGWNVIVIEKNTDLRASGYMLGLSGPGYSAIEKMGMLEALQKHQYRYQVDKNEYFNTKGRKIFSLNIEKIWGSIKILMLSRTDLVNELYIKASEKKNIDIKFSCLVTSFENNADNAKVYLSDGSAITADLVIGADGVNSQVRKALFPTQDSKSREYLGYKVAAFATDEVAEQVKNFKSFSEPGRIVELYPVGKDKSAGLYLWKSSSNAVITSPSIKRAELTAQFSNSHPLIKRKISSLDDASPLFFDNLVMIDLPKWSQGRVVLIGDSAHCLTLLSGQGAGIAMISSYLLAKSLQRYGINQGLEDHEKRLRPVIVRLQERSRKLATWFIPASKLSFNLRNLVVRLMPNALIGWFFLRAIRSDIIAASLDEAS
ncbi:FAD-dependent oxidoreductase [Marinomonas rhizomae]|uniref:2-polyprenyl-6-methoxyphenol hydroxylase-like FAD-dependent oxidoreductase n=1 Tax=Marinomonas rhizomae TaxID=491948 RepID=A0A366JDE8_9GAMM|nr:FAD-dependent oxidoreductase [Marinomonas rhizomae]RBP85011.1 2-polyprenyl-6-methoxyphenol hydroxylase-like FAD-dependent oxidoreductase [Marinomonas rhizomae]RNF76126.1 FAD-dependent oxidoreductase [Marinomonas rhizomae]